MDEASIVDVPPMNAPTKAVPEHAGLLPVGDVEQLPAAGPGQVLAVVIASAAASVARRTEVFRRAAASRSIVDAHRINAGRMPEPARRAAEGADSDLPGILIDEPEPAAATLVEIVTERIPARFGLDPARRGCAIEPSARASHVRHLLPQAKN